MWPMKASEQLKLDVITRVLTGQMERKDGQALLDVSSRTLERYLSEYRKRGPLSLRHGNSERAPWNKTPDEFKRQIQALVEQKYFDFNLTHCLEKLTVDEGISGLMKRETFRKWCHERGMVKRAKKRRARARHKRERMKQTGLMLQMDGSPHRWFGNVSSCLIGAIDDADSDVPFAEFFPAEDTLSCLHVLRKIVEKRGLFQVLYVDRAGLFGGAKRSNFSQVKRALSELGIHVIFASSPEAKGRIERLWDTLQDRLIPELRLRQIKTYPAANSFLQEQFLPEHYARKFKVLPANPQSAYRALPEGVDLKEVFCLKETRAVARDHTISWDGRTYALKSPHEYSIYRQTIELRTYPEDLSWKAFYAGRPIDLTPCQPPLRASPEPLLKRAA